MKRIREFYSVSTVLVFWLFLLFQTATSVCDLWTEPGFVCNLSTHFNCYKDCCALGVAFCYPQQQKCRFCQEHKNLCATEKMDVACFHYCQQLQQPNALYSIQDDNYIRVRMGALIGGGVTAGVVAIAIIACLIHLLMKAKKNSRKQSEEATSLMVGMDDKGVDENVNYPTSISSSSRPDSTASDSSVNLGNLNLNKVHTDDQSSTSSQHSGDSSAGKQSVPDQAVCSTPTACDRVEMETPQRATPTACDRVEVDTPQRATPTACDRVEVHTPQRATPTPQYPSHAVRATPAGPCQEMLCAPGANVHPTFTNPDPAPHRGYTAVTPDSANDVHNTRPHFSALHPTPDTDNEPVSVPLSTKPCHLGYKQAI